ncbi:MAG: hypothetical protein R2822_21570 [Spirosomataceae bacterium]
MKDKLQRFVRDNREAFDVHEPSDALWEKLSQKLPNEIASQQIDFKIERQRKQWNWRIAASITLLIGIGWVGYSVYQNYGVATSPEFALTNPTYAKQVSQYTQLIDAKRIELSEMTKNNPALYEEFAGELEQLERSYQNLKIDLPKNPNQEIVIQAMIQNLQWQIDLLNKQLDIIQRIKNKNNHANDKIA